MPATQGDRSGTPGRVILITGSGSGIGAAKRFMTRSLHEIFGPDADSLTGKVDKAQTVAELREVALKHKDLIASMSSRSKSEAYWRGIEELLPEL